MTTRETDAVAQRRRQPAQPILPPAEARAAEDANQQQHEQHGKNNCERIPVGDASAIPSATATQQEEDDKDNEDQRDHRNVLSALARSGLRTVVAAGKRQRAVAVIGEAAVVVLGDARILRLHLAPDGRQLAAGGVLRAARQGVAGVGFITQRIGSLAGYREYAGWQLAASLRCESGHFHAPSPMSPSDPISSAETCFLPDFYGFSLV